jgi:hypothetical protein
MMRESGCAALQETQTQIRSRIGHSPQCIEVLIPFHALSRAPHGSCLPCALPIGHSSIKSSAFTKEALEMGKAMRSEN